METLFEQKQNRIKGAFASDFFTKRYNSMKNRLSLQNEALLRQISGFWRLIRSKDEEISKLKAENAELLVKLRNFAEQDKISNLF